jgi:hypothetical protein
MSNSFTGTGYYSLSKPPVMENWDFVQNFLLLNSLALMANEYHLLTALASGPYQMLRTWLMGPEAHIKQGYPSL